mmetsp:Transcript_82887/g.208870  ORF Transcript_82887/g.208870 Transcript_82887/m.208870 type:complete len:338 (+) Transcript_82887:489-1502(+)
MLGDPALVAHHALRELTVAASGASSPDIALDAQQVDAADDAPEAAVRKVGTPRILPGPIRHASGAVGAPAQELDAMAALPRRALGAVVDALRHIVPKGWEVGVDIDASVDRAVGHDLDLHPPDLAVHGGPLRLRPRLVGAPLLERLVLLPVPALWKVLLHDPAKRIDGDPLGLQARVSTLVEVADVAPVVEGVLARAKARGVGRATALLSRIHGREPLMIEESPRILSLTPVAAVGRGVERVPGLVAAVHRIEVVRGGARDVEVATTHQRLRAHEEGAPLAAMRVCHTHGALSDAPPRLLEHALHCAHPIGPSVRQRHRAPVFQQVDARSISQNMGC